MSHWRNAKLCGLILCAWAFSVAATTLIVRHIPRHHDKCVVCHPSGKLAM
jgi:hypothetical protein